MEGEMKEEAYGRAEILLHINDEKRRPKFGSRSTEDIGKEFPRQRRDPRQHWDTC